MNLCMIIANSFIYYCKVNNRTPVLDPCFSKIKAIKDIEETIVEKYQKQPCYYHRDVCSWILAK